MKFKLTRNVKAKKDTVGTFRYKYCKTRLLLFLDQKKVDTMNRHILLKSLI